MKVIALAGSGRTGNTLLSVVGPAKFIRSPECKLIASQGGRSGAPRSLVSQVRHLSGVLIIREALEAVC